MQPEVSAILSFVGAMNQNYSAAGPGHREHLVDGQGWVVAVVKAIFGIGYIKAEGLEAGGEFLALKSLGFHDGRDSVPREKLIVFIGQHVNSDDVETMALMNLAENGQGAGADVENIAMIRVYETRDEFIDWTVGIQSPLVVLGSGGAVRSQPIIPKVQFGGESRAPNLFCRAQMSIYSVEGHQEPFQLGLNPFPASDTQGSTGYGFDEPLSGLHFLDLLLYYGC